MKTISIGIFGIFVLVLAGLLIASAGAAGIPGLGSFTGSSDEPTLGTQTDSVHKLGTIKYYVNELGGVTKHTLDASDTITVHPGNTLVLQVPALVSGPTNQWGQVLLWWPGPDIVSHSLLLKPGKWGKLTTQNSPLRWTTAPATGIVVVAVYAPDGGFTIRTITINVT